MSKITISEIQYYILFASHGKYLKIKMLGKAKGINTSPGDEIRRIIETELPKRSTSGVSIYIRESMEEDNWVCCLEDVKDFEHRKPNDSEKFDTVYVYYFEDVTYKTPSLHMFFNHEKSN